MADRNVWVVKIDHPILYACDITSIKTFVECFHFTCVRSICAALIHLSQL